MAVGRPQGCLEGTRSIQAIETVPRELFYWLAILFTFALGTAAGDWVAEGLSLGYAWVGPLFGGRIAVTAVAGSHLRTDVVASVRSPMC